jgi:hypothetical protein
MSCEGAASSLPGRHVTCENSASTVPAQRAARWWSEWRPRLAGAGYSAGPRLAPRRIGGQHVVPVRAGGAGRRQFGRVMTPPECLEGGMSAGERPDNSGGADGLARPAVRADAGRVVAAVPDQGAGEGPGPRSAQSAPQPQHPARAPPVRAAARDGLSHAPAQSAATAGKPSRRAGRVAVTLRTRWWPRFLVAGVLLVVIGGTVLSGIAQALVAGAGAAVIVTLMAKSGSSSNDEKYEQPSPPGAPPPQAGIGV